jgi:hypothetical protein
MNDEIAWLIELNLPHSTASPEWFIGGPINSVEFSNDSLKAVRFSRRRDAQAMLDWLSINEKLLVMHENVPTMYSVTEHIWINTSEIK